MADFVSRGLELFAGGDLGGAAEMWLRAQRDGSQSPLVDAYLRHVRNIDPVAYARAETAAAGPLVTPMVASAAPSTGSVPSGTGTQTAPASIEPDESFVALHQPLPAYAPARPSGAARPVSGAVPFELPPAPADDHSPNLPPLSTGPAGANGGAVPGAVFSGQVGDFDPWDTAGPGPTSSVDNRAPGMALVSGELHQPARPPTAPVAVDELGQMEGRLKDLFELHDFTGALELADRILAARPEHPRAIEVRASCRDRLQRMYASKIGAPELVPRVLKSPEELIWLDLDHRSGFVLAQVDGASSFEDIIAITGMEPFESYRILARLVQDGVIGVRA